MGVGVGTASTLTFDDAATTYDALELLSFTFDDISIPEVDFSKMGTGTVAFWKSGKITEPGSITFEVHWDETIGIQPMGEPAADQHVTISFQGTPGGGSNKWRVSGWIQSWSVNVPLEDKMTATIRFKCTGAITKVA